MRRSINPALIAALLLAPGAAGAGVIRGHVRVVTALPPAPMTHSAYFGRARELPVTPPTVRGLVSDAVVYIEDAPASAESLQRATEPLPVLAQKGQAFVPRVLPIPVGAVVDMPNFDRVYHNVFSLSPVRSFDLGRYPMGQSRRVRFDRPGLVNVFCDIHSNMAAFVLVLSHPLIARPGLNGAFALPSLPPGHYTLHVWHPDLPPWRGEVEVGDKAGAEVEVTL
jgi:plastocyanin